MKTFYDIRKLIYINIRNEYGFAKSFNKKWNYISIEKLNNINVFPNDD